MDENNVKKYITSLLTSTPLVMTVRQLSNDYNNTIGTEIPYHKLGYNSLEHFLRSIPDTVQIRGAGHLAEVLPVISDKSAHINQLVVHQRTVPKNKRNYSQQKRSKRVTHPSEYNFKNERKSSPPQENKVFYSSKNKGPLKDTTKDPFVPQKNNSPPPQSNSNKTPYNSDYSARSNFEPQKGRVDSSGDAKKPNFVEKAQLETGPSTSNTSNQNLLIKPQKFLSDLNKLSLSQVEIAVPLHVRNNLKTLIKNCPDGIWCREVPDKYRHMFRRELNYQELGFKSLIHLCVSLSSIFHYVRPSTEDYKLYDRSRPLPECAEKRYTMASYAPKTGVDYDKALPDLDWEDMKQYFPADVFVPGREIPRTFVPENTKDNDNIDIVIGEVYDLSKFWCFIDDSKLNDLMDDLQEFYKEHKEEYIIPKNLIREGMYCVQVIFGEYHRALIVDTLPDLEDYIRVIFIDYGTMMKVSAQGLCFLQEDFAKLEAQAIRCRMANVFPVEDGAPWSREACKAFRTLIVNRDITAKINHINWEEQYLEVFLADVTDEENIFYINDRLVELGHAVHSNQERWQSLADPVYTPIVKFIHLFPTFLELEHGMAPSTGEMEVLTDCDVPINFCYPQYFYADRSAEEKAIKRAEAFHEKHCMKSKRRTPLARCFDRTQFKPKPLDMSVFGSLADEIRESLGGSLKAEEVVLSDEDFVDADEDSEQACKLDVLTRRVEQLDVKPSCLDALKQEVMVTESIIKEVDELFEAGISEDIAKDVHDLVKNDLAKWQSDILKNWEATCQNDLPKVATTSRGSVENSDLWFQNHSANSGLMVRNDLINCDKAFEENEANSDLTSTNDLKSCDKMIQNDLTNVDLKVENVQVNGENVSPKSTKVTLATNVEEDSGSGLSQSPPNDAKHPLNTIKFTSDTSGSTSGNSSDGSDDRKAPKVRLGEIRFSFLPEEHPKSISRLMKEESQYRINSFLSDQYCTVSVHLATKNEAESTKSTFGSTNPFLSDMQEGSDSSTSVPPLNPNNPFLTYQGRSSGSEESQASTVYDRSAPKHSWSSFEDMPAETISQLGKSLKSKSTSSGSYEYAGSTEERRTSSTQTAEEAVQVEASPNHVPPPQYAFQPWTSCNYNPFYNTRFVNFHGCESQFRPSYGVGAPPGFQQPNYRQPGLVPVPFGWGNVQFPSASCYGNVPGYGGVPYRPQAAAGFCHGMSAPCAVPPVAVAPNVHGGAVCSSAASVSLVVPKESVPIVDGKKDFYEVYNQQLQQRIQKGGQ